MASKKTPQTVVVQNKSSIGAYLIGGIMTLAFIIIFILLAFVILLSALIFAPGLFPQEVSQGLRSIAGPAFMPANVSAQAGATQYPVVQGIGVNYSAQIAQNKTPSQGGSATSGSATNPMIPTFGSTNPATTTPSQGQGCVELWGVCSGECCEGLVCTQGVCIQNLETCKEFAQACASTNECCPGNECDNGFCKSTQGCQVKNEQCGIGNDGTWYGPCCAGYDCLSGVCISLEAPQERCVEQNQFCGVKNAIQYGDCCADLTCTANVCKNYSARAEVEDCLFIGEMCGTKNGIAYGTCCTGFACINNLCQSNVMTMTCVDSDIAGNDAYGVSKSLIGNHTVDIKYDTCKDEYTLYEYDCLANGSIIKYEIPCPSGCLNGACKPQETVSGCTDSDDGLNYAIRGTTITSNGEVEEDRCNNAQNVEEFYCKPDGTIGEYGYSCSQGYKCVDGACILRDAANCKQYAEPCGTVYGTCCSSYVCANGVCLTASEATRCTDTDGGNVPTVYGVLNLPTGFVGADYCLSNGKLVEFYCTADNYAVMETACASGYVCSGGACVQGAGGTTIAFTCTDSDNGKNYNLKGVITNSSGATLGTDTCYYDGALSEFYCQNGVMQTERYNCPSGYSCSNGACINTCNDSDGADYYTVGAVTATNGAYNDMCTNTTRLLERICTNGIAASSYYDCPINYACSGGKCIWQPAAPVCTDSDGGKDSSTRGTVVIDFGTSNSTYTDYCMNTSLAVEYYCVQNSAGSMTMQCGLLKKCDKGRCVSSLVIK
ncbi:MAG: hypothetical protein WC492_03640 [Candidatus Micrarchaeia archaeon]